MIHDKVDIKEIQYDTENEFMVIIVNETFRQGMKYLVHIPFEAPLNSGLHGYYKSSYYDQTRKQKIWLSVTQFEPTAARYAFPCEF